MTEPQWKTWTPQYDGHTPDDWVEGTNAECFNAYNAWVDAGPYPRWIGDVKYRYHAKQATIAGITAQCIALPQAEREALIEALQKPQRDWADDVWSKADEAFGNDGKAAAADVIRSMCRPKEEN